MEIESGLIENRVKENFDINNIQNIEINDIGWNTNYVLTINSKKYFMKTFITNSENNESSFEIHACQVLNNAGIKTSSFIENKNGEFINILNNEKSYHIQNFIEGETWRKNSAPSWLVKKDIDLAANIHVALSELKLNTRKSIEIINEKQYHIRRIKKIIYNLQKIKQLKNKKLYLEDLHYRLSFIEESEELDLNKLTMVNGHGDYSITQLLTSNKEITAVIDMTEVSRVPAIWELMRFYLNSAPNSETGIPDFDEFLFYLNYYSEKIPLNSYDYEKMFIINQLYMCQALSVYENLIKSANPKFEERAILRAKKIECFSKMEKYFTIKFKGGN